MPVISTLRARSRPMTAPITMATAISAMAAAVMLREASPMVATSAIAMPAMPKVEAGAGRLVPGQARPGSG